MNILLGFVPRLLDLVKGGLDAASAGVMAVRDMSKENPKQSGVYALILGWLGIDPTMFHNIGSVMDRVAGWLMAL